MSREIKFRAWKKENSPEMIHIVNSIDWENKEISFRYRLNSWTFRDDKESLDNIILMQYTGLKDNNGVEIYEGDIIGSENKGSHTWYVSHHKVVWYDSGFMGKQICSASFIGLDYWTSGKDGYVVIGNIYENPELLEVK